MLMHIGYRGSSWTLLNVAVMRVSMFGYCLEVRSNVKYIQPRARGTGYVPRHPLKLYRRCIR